QPGSPLFPYTTLFRSQFDEMLRLLQMAVADWGLAYLTSPDIGTIVSHSSLGDEPPPSDLDTMEALVTEVSPTLAGVIEDGRRRRSEEHTSELQSRENL